MRKTIIALALLCTLTLFAADRPASRAQEPPPSRSVLPNGPYAPGANAVVVMGGGGAPDVATRIGTDSGLRVDVLWVLDSGRWTYFLPAQPSVGGGLSQFRPTPMAALAVLSSPQGSSGRQKTVVIDAGHGADEIGAADNGVVEKTSNVDFALRVERMLSAQGIRVILTRRDDGRSVTFPKALGYTGYNGTYVDLQARADLANAENADLFVSLHSNGASVPVRGVEAWYDPHRPFADKNATLARLLLDNVLSELRSYGYPAIDRGLKDDTCYRSIFGHCAPLFLLGSEYTTTREEILDRGGDPAVFLAPGQSASTNRPTKMPGALIELLFISEPTDAAVLRDEAGREAMARGVTNGIMQMLGGGAPGTRTAPAAAPARPGNAEVVARGPADRNVVSLTFDAGADLGYTERILDTLKANNIRASFGMTGHWAEENPEMMKRIVREGHHLINHTYSHDSFTGYSTDRARMTQAQRWSELDRTEEIVQRLTGATTKPYFRPPYGDYDSTVNADVGARGYQYNVMWTVDSMGWMGLSAPEIVARTLRLTVPGSVIIFHVGSQSQDAFALQTIIDGLRRAGYSFATVAELLDPGSTPPDKSLQ